MASLFAGIPSAVIAQQLTPLSLFISPCETQLSATEHQLTAALDSADKYRLVYGLEKQISSGFKQVYQIEKVKSARADSMRLKAQDLLVVMVGQRNALADRAEKAEAALKPISDELARYKGRTWAGKTLRKVRDGLAGVGGVVVVVGIVLKTLL